MIEESNLSKCRCCGEIKPRIQDGKYFDNKNKRWRDDKGQLWSGRRCGDCQKLEMKKRMQKKRSKEKDDKSTSES